MGEPKPATFNRDDSESLDYDMLIIGAGLTGIYSLASMQQLGLRAQVLEGATDLGGGW
jgi:cation diffusion facilitator CzcD-associated flavoprotein CzcO